MVDTVDNMMRNHGGTTATSMMCLLDLLCDAHIDDERTLMHEVIQACGDEALSALSAASRWHHEKCKSRLLVLKQQHTAMEIDLASKLGYLCHNQLCKDPWQCLSNIRALTIPDTLPPNLRPLLGRWLKPNGRLSQVSCVRCRSWIQEGEIIGWIELDSLRDEGPKCLSAQLRCAMERLDTTDGLLKTVLRHAQRGAAHPWLIMHDRTQSEG